MQYRTLGKTGIKVSRLCFGSLTVGPCQADLNADAAGEIIAYALSLGVNFIDTAQLYKTYPHIRRGLELAGCPDAVIASKTYAYTAETARAAVDENAHGGESFMPGCRIPPAPLGDTGQVGYITRLRL